MVSVSQDVLVLMNPPAPQAASHTGLKGLSVCLWVCVCVGGIQWRDRNVVTVPKFTQLLIMLTLASQSKAAVGLQHQKLQGLPMGFF